MNLWSRLMNLFGIAPKPPVSPPKYDEQERQLHEQIVAAGERHKAATNMVIRSSLDEVDRAKHVSLAINTIVKRLEVDNDPTLRLAQGALDLVQRTPKK